MAWVKAEYSLTQVKAAGRKLRTRLSSEERSETLRILANWRSLHIPSLGRIRASVERNARRISSSALVVHRLKRLPSIQRKLLLEPTMCITQMQDIGGCRAIMPTLGGAIELCGNLEHKENWKVVRNYIVDPKSDGYRSIHLVHKSQSRVGYTIRTELQIRSQLQHAWATAVETVTTYTGKDIRAGQDRDWAEFFSLASALFCKMEGTRAIPGVPTDEIEIGKQLYELEMRVRPIDALRHFTMATFDLPTTEQVGTPCYCILELNRAKHSVATRMFRAELAEEVFKEYVRIEEEGNPDVDVVMISIEIIDDLRRAYPNWYLDTGLFLDQLTLAMLRSSAER